MAVYKDKNGWKAVYRYKTWDGKTKQTTRRNFRTKKEALVYEAQVRLRKNADMNMTLEEFVPIYFEDKKNEIAQTSTYNKKDMINRHVIPKENKQFKKKVLEFLEEHGLADAFQSFLKQKTGSIKAKLTNAISQTRSREAPDEEHKKNKKVLQQPEL